MSTHPALSPLCDPIGIGKLQILLVPVQPAQRDGPSPRLSQAVFSHWSGLFRRHQSLRGDEILPPPPVAGASGSQHVRGGPSNPRSRFLPSSTATSISRANVNQHVHLAFPSHPPARHLYPLNLLRLTTFPLVVIGIALETTDEAATPMQSGYSLGDEDSGDIAEASTPRLAGHKPPDNLETFEEVLSELFPPSSAYPLVRRLILVPPALPRSPDPNPSPRKGAMNGGDSRRASVKGKEREDVRCAPMEGAEAWVGMLLGELVGEVLGELGELATALETPTGLKTLSSTLLPSLTSTTNNTNLVHSRSATPSHSARPSSSTPSGQPSSLSVDTLHSLSGSMGISFNRSLTPGGRPTSVGPASATPIQSPVSAPEARPISSSSNPFRRSTAISSPFSRTPSANSVTATTSSAGGTPALGAKYSNAALSGVAGGRLLKFLGDIYLLTGMYGDAIKCYDDGAERCRVVGDVLWEACAREGRAVAGIGEAWEGRDGSDKCQPFSSSPIPIEIMAHYLSALSCLSRAPLPYPPTILSPSPQAVSGSLSLPAPSMQGSVHLGTGEGLLAYLYTSLCLRIAHFQLILWTVGGWGSIALSCLMSHTLPRTFPPPLDEQGLQDPFARQRRHRFYSLLSARSGLTRLAIFAHAETATGPIHRAMTKPEQLAVHVEVVWLSKWLDLPRHEAIYAREVAKRLGGMIVEGREEARRLARAGFRKSAHVDAKPNGTGGEGSVGLGLGMPVSSASREVAVRRKESTEGNAAVMLIVERIASMIGVALLPPLTPSSSLSSTVTNSDSAIVGHRHKFGWPEIQVDTIQSLVSVAEHLGDQEMVIRLAVSALRGLYGYLSPPSQGHLVRLMQNGLGTLKRRGRWHGGLAWWVPGKVVLSLEVAALPPNRIPSEHSASEMQKQGKKKDPFLYNPRVKLADTGKTVIVANEQVDLFVTLSNPFAFDLDIADLSLITDGVQFLANPLPLLLPANSVQTVRVTGTTPSSGVLHIQGVHIRLPDGSTSQIFLPVIDDKARMRQEKRQSKAASDLGKMKRSGMEARFAPVESEKADQTATKGAAADEQRSDGKLEEGERWLECQVVKEMPLLWVKSSNLTHGTVMLYDGETTTIRLTLENSSGTPFNFLKLSFEDNTTREAQAILNEELAAKDAYEVEWDMIHRPVFQWDPAAVESLEVQPGGRCTVSVRCLGKVGCTEGSIRIDYGSIDRSDGEIQPCVFHTRQIIFPISFTVYQTLELFDLDILRLSQPVSASAPSNEQLPNGFASEEERVTFAGASGESKHAGPVREDTLRSVLGSSERDCLVAVSVRNVYGVPFEVSITRQGKGLDHGGSHAVTSARLVPPGATERLLVPVPRVSLPSITLAAPIPTLSDRQYIVDKSGRTPAQVKADLELFWYRQHLLDRLGMSWIEPGSKREGGLSMRRLSLDGPMVGVLKLDEVVLRVTIGDGGRIRAGDFVEVEVAVINQLEERSIIPRIRLEPVSPLDASKRVSQHPTPVRHIVFDGMLSGTLPTLAPGEQCRHTVSAIFLAEGDFAFRAIVDDLTEEAGMVGQSGLWWSEITPVRVG